MQKLKVILVALVLLLNLAIAPAAWADRISLTDTPEYATVTQAIDALLQAKSNPKEGGESPEKIEQKLGELKLQKYILETARGGALCRNQTGKTLAIYAHKLEKPNAEPTLYYLGNGQVTDDEWNCDGVYFPSGAKIAGVSPDGQALTEPQVVQVVSGTQLIATASPDTGVVSLNVKPAKVLKAGEGSLTIPALTQAEIDAQSLNAPIDD